MRRLLLLILLPLLLTGEAAGQAVRLKDLVDVEGMRGNDLIGYGIVVGLNGTGDSLRNSPYTEEALVSLLERLGVNIQDDQFRPDNVAAVIVTAELPPFARAGSRIDVSVSSMGDAESLQGGVLVMTPLLGADNQVYAVAQGPLTVGGFEARGQAGSAVKGTPTLGTIAGGARVEQEVNFAFGDLEELRLALRDPDFTTAKRITDALNTLFEREVAEMLDAGTVLLDSKRTKMPAPEMMASIEGMYLTPARRARVVIDQRSGTIVLGEDVRIAPVAVAQGSLTIQVAETPVASQPGAFSRGRSVVLPRTSITAEEEAAAVGTLASGASLKDLIEGLNALNVPPRDMVEIFEALKAAGALHAEIVLQ
jgi:flagellar P-ring protein precursor FlgI